MLLFACLLPPPIGFLDPPTALHGSSGHRGRQRLKSKEVHVALHKDGQRSDRRERSMNYLQ